MDVVFFVVLFVALWVAAVFFAWDIIPDTVKGYIPVFLGLGAMAALFKTKKPPPKREANDMRKEASVIRIEAEEGAKVTHLKIEEANSAKKIADLWNQGRDS